MEDVNMQEEFENRMGDIRKERETYQEQLSIKKRVEEEFEVSFFNDMRELEAMKAENWNNSALIDKTEECQNTLQDIKRKIDDMFETMQKDLTQKIKDLDDKEGHLQYEIAQMKK